MKIVLEQVGKQFAYEWIFRQINYTFEEKGKYAILGSNGSGKSTLMKVLAGHLTPTKGQVKFLRDEKALPASEVYQHLSYAAPYIELIEELTLTELFSFHARFRPLLRGIKPKNVIDIMQFSKAASRREIKLFSSGMKQRAKLALALLTNASLVLLDEPTTNLDTEGMEWYNSLIERFAMDRTVIVATNEERDYAFCDEVLKVMNYKKKTTT